MKKLTFNEGPRPFTMGKYCRHSESTLTTFDNLLLQNYCYNFYQILDQNHLVKMICSNEGLSPDLGDIRK